MFSPLEQIAAALEKYYDKKKEYPTTGGNLQTVCTYEEIDAGCKLKDFLDPIPADPRGDPAQTATGTPPTARATA